MKLPRQKTFCRITIAATVSGMAGRDYLSGVFRFSEEAPHWALDVLDTPDELANHLRKQEKPDGLILMFPHASMVRAKMKLPAIPTVVVDFPPPGFASFVGRTSFVRLDDPVIGVAAAEHLLSRGHFNSYLCIIDQPQFAYSQARAQSFREALSATGAFVETVELGERHTLKRDLRVLARTLKRLQRPIGVFAIRDRAAIRIYDACRPLGFSIPEEVAILGVDNDELFCNTRAVPLSSILPDHRRIGFLAARELDRLMKGGKGQEIVLRQSVKDIMLRASTRIIPPAARIVTEALSFIDRNASGVLRVSDVVRHLGCSRRLADLRFRQMRNETIKDAIARARVDHIKSRLQTAGVPISRIAEECGFSSPAVFTRFFKARTGQTPTAWQHVRASGGGIKMPNVIFAT